MSKRESAMGLGPSSRTGCRVLVAATLLVAVAAGYPAAAQNCPGDIGCANCELRWLPGADEPFFLCRITFESGACACFTWIQGGAEVCQEYGLCLYTGWQGGDPPRV